MKINDREALFNGVRYEIQPNDIVLLNGSVFKNEESETKKILEFLASEKERLADIVDARFEKINRTVQECRKLSR
jgi:hypothetical protein